MGSDWGWKSLVASRKEGLVRGSGSNCSEQLRKRERKGGEGGKGDDELELRTDPSHPLALATEEQSGLTTTL